MRAALASCCKIASHRYCNRRIFSIEGVSLFSTSRRRSRNNHLLESPSFLFTSNHLLVVNKPAGWHTVPNATGGQSKCLISYLKRKKLGGGSKQNFLLPLHRIDQPCTGVLILGKTSKAASRIQTKWPLVKKMYMCILDSNDETDQKRLQEASMNLSDGWMQLEGYLQRRRTKHSDDSQREGGWSVRMFPISHGTQHSIERLRLCQLQWKIISPSSSPHVILEVRTHQGARHMIRALLSQCGGSSIAGDLRYHASRALPDRSVALHARRLQLPQTLQLGGLEQQREFVAPIPSSWKESFGITEDMIQEWEIQ